MTSQIQLNLDPPICKLNDTPRVARTVPRHCRKRGEWVVPQLLGWSFHSLAYEITQLLKTSHTTFHGPCTLLYDGPHPVHCASLWIWTNSPLIYYCLSLNFFAMRNEKPEFHSVLKPGTVGFGQAQVPVRYDWVTKRSRVPAMRVWVPK